MFIFFGVRSDRSWFKNVLHNIKIVITLVGKRLPINFINFDFSKVFGKMPYNHLVNEIRTNGIGCFVANWMES